MFRSRSKVELPDFSASLREASFFKYGQLAALALGGEITALAQDPVLSLLALGTSAGTVHVYGGEGFRFALPVTMESRRMGRPASSAPGSPVSSGAAPSNRTSSAANAASSSRPPPGIKFVTFHPGLKLIAIDDKDTLYQYDLTNISDSPIPAAHPPLPVRDAAYSLVGDVRAIETPSPSHSWLFLGMGDGSVRAWDLRRGELAEFRIENLWHAHEERLRRSGVERPRTQAPITALALNPRDLNVLLIGYSGGVVAYDFRAAQGVRVFEAVHAPGAPGGGSYADAERLWRERAPPVTALAWRDDGLVFCAGHADGCLSFWALGDEKPLMVRTLTHEDVNIADAEALVAAGALHAQLAAKAEGAFAHAAVTPPAVADREPVYKLAWASFSPASDARAYAERGESLLLVLGGQAGGEKPGISILQLPPYSPPPVAKGAKVLKSAEGLSRAERSAYRASLLPTGASAYRSKTPPEDFLLLSPSPYFGQAQDAAALFVLLTPDPRLPPCGADRELEAYAFPPVRSGTPPPALGRKDFALPGEGDVMAQPQTQGTRARRNSVRRFPWSAPDRGSVLSSRSVRRARDGALAVPSGTWAGARALRGAKLVPLPAGSFGRLLAGLDEMRVPLRGGLAVPDFKSSGAPDPSVQEGYRVMVSWHADARVRFHDVSPQLLLQVPLAFEYPNPLSHLTIDVARIVRETSVSPDASTALPKERPVIVGVELAPESLECAVALASGQVVVCKFAEASEGRASMSTTGSPGESPILEEADPLKGHNEEEKETAGAPAEEKKDATEEAALEEKMEDVSLDDELEDVSLDEDAAPPRLYRGWDGRFDGRASPEPAPEPAAPPVPATQVVDLTHLAKRDVDGFRPVALFNLAGRVSALALSDIGFVGVALGPQLVIIDMRGPRVLHAEVLEHPAALLKWAVCGVGSDATPRPRLFVVCDGATRVYPLLNQKGWAAGKPAPFSSLERPVAAFVLDPETGEEMSATGAAFAASMQAPEQHHGHRHSLLEGKKTHCVYVAAGRSTIRASANVTGDRLAKADAPGLTAAHYLARNGGRVLVGITPTQAAFFSAPRLEPITRLDMYYGEAAALGALSFDAASGDFLEFRGAADLSLKTVFNFRKPLPPRLDPTYYKHAAGAQPQPLSAGVFSWMWASGPLSGAGLDALVGGPERTLSKSTTPPKAPIMSWADPAPKQKETRRVSGPAQSEGSGMTGAGGGIYAELQAKFRQRGEVVGMLEESVDQLAHTTQGFVEAARRAAAAEAGKSSAKSFFKF